MLWFGDIIESADRLKGRIGQRRQSLGAVLGALGNRRDRAYEAANMGLQERFGQSLQRLEDAIASQAGGRRRAITRAMMAGGGDITGQAGALFGELTESTNEALGEAIRQYADLSLIHI